MEVDKEALEDLILDDPEELVVPDVGTEQFAAAFGFENAENKDAVGCAADGIEGNGGHLNEPVGEIGQVLAEGSDRFRRPEKGRRTGD